MDKIRLCVLPENTSSDRPPQSSGLSEIGSCVEMESGLVTLRAANKSPGSGAEWGSADNDWSTLASLNPSKPRTTQSQLKASRDLLAVQIPITGRLVDQTERN